MTYYNKPDVWTSLALGRGTVKEKPQGWGFLKKII